MKTIQQIGKSRVNIGHPLEIDGQNIHELSQRDPKAAYELVFREVDRRGGHRALINYKSRQSCIHKAMAKPLPGAAESAFTSGAIKAAGKTVYRVVPTHFMLLQALKSPVLAMIESATSEKKSEVDFTDEQQWELCHVFTENPKALRQRMKSEGVDAIKKDAETNCSEWSAAEVNFVMLAIMEQLKRHIETTVRFAADMKEKGEVTFFLEKPLAN